jgi:hypothetical protein
MHMRINEFKKLFLGAKRGIKHTHTKKKLKKPKMSL